VTTIFIVRSHCDGRRGIELSVVDARAAPDGEKTPSVGELLDPLVAVVHHEDVGV